MSEHESAFVDEPMRLSTAAVLGLNDPADEQWAHLRGLQYSSLAKVTRYRMIMHLILAVLTVAVLRSEVAIWWLAPWAAALGYVHLRGMRFDNGLADTNKRRITKEEFRYQLVTPVASGLLWSVALLVFAPQAGGVESAVVWTIVAVLITASTLFYTAAPLGILVFAAIVGVAGLASLILQGLYPMAAAAFTFLAVSMIGSVETGRTFLLARTAEEGMAEKNSVVSLLLREFEENEADWLWEVDPSRRVRGASPRFAYALGRHQSEAEGRPLLEMIAGHGWDTGNLPPTLHELADKLKNQQSFSNLLVEVSIRGERRWWELSGTPIQSESGRFTGFRGVGSDVTAQRESSDKIAYLARYDTLTTLPNRLQLTETLGEALNYADQWNTRCAFLMIDLDRFKSVNDSLGHLVGDRLLAQVSARLKGLMGDNQLCGRLGGDEFAVVIRDATDHRIIDKVARTVIASLSEPYIVDNHTLYVGASVGSAIGPRDGRSVEELMRNADLALYRAKDEGGNDHFAYEPNLHIVAEERRQLELSLRKALDNNEFRLDYQPVVDANQEHAVGFEALIRWDSPDHGLVSPAKFIPIAEDTRLIIPIGQWVLYQACKEALKWPDHIKINVNVSPEQLLDPGFTDDVVRVLSKTGLRPQRLEIEVTESIFVRDASVARNALEQVMALGCSVALDDFGTGYSSLGYIRKLRFSTIKIDRTFVIGAAQQSAESLAIIRAVVAMAQSLEMTTTAEGVETAEQAKLIRELGCDKIQGYYFGRPMSAEDAGKIFAVRHNQQRA